jgi:hypothetical protein
VHAATGFSGIVTNAGNSQPIRYARVCCRAESSRAYSDSTGFYVFSQLAPGTYTVTVTASGFQPDTYPEPVVVVQDSVTPDINFALHPPPTGGIPGQVVDAENQQPIANAYVYAVGTQFHAYTDSTGYYEMQGVAVGKYLLHARADWYVYETYPESVAVVENQVTPDIDFALGPAGAISGRVTSAGTGQAISGASVYAFGPNGSATVTTDTGGRYSIYCQLAPGRYRVRASATGFQTAYYPDSVTVFAGEMTPDINFALAMNGGITGQVTNAQTSEPVFHASVGNGQGSAYTDSNGVYVIATNPGSYRVFCYATGYASGIYPESVLVVQGQVTESIDFALIPYGGQTGISGRITDAVTQLPVGAATVIAQGPNGCDTTQSVSIGSFFISGLAAGRYQVRAEADGYQTLVFPESVTVVNGQVREYTNLYLVPSNGPMGAVSGRVTSSQNGQVIVGAQVSASGPNGSGTAQQGTYGYLIYNLPPGKYRVTATASGFSPGYYPDSVVVDSGQTTENINFQLVPTAQVGRLTGHVTCDTGQLIVNALVYATNPQYSYQVLQGQQDYHFYLPAGKYWVSAEAEGFEPGHYPDSVTVVAGQNTPGIDFALDRVPDTLGGVSGLVTNAQTHDPILGALVIATGPGQGYTNTGAQGTYTIRGLIPGTYMVMACAAGFQPSTWDTVEVLASNITPDVDFALQPTGGGGTGGIGGNVVDAMTRQPIPGTRLFAWGSTGQGCAYSDASGNYLVHNLRAGWYRVRAEVSDYYPATCPESVHVTDGQTTSDIGFSMDDVGDLVAGIAGFAYNGYLQTEIVGARVRVTGCEGSWDAFTDERGDYVADGLPPGEYRVEFSAEGYGSGVYAGFVTTANGAISAWVNPVLYARTPILERPVPDAVPTRGNLRVVGNPCPGRAQLQLQLPVAGPAVLRIFDNLGRVTRTIECGYRAAGVHMVNWDGSNDRGRLVANGIYFCRLDAPGFTVTRKLVLQR